MPAQDVKLGVTGLIQHKSMMEPLTEPSSSNVWLRQLSDDRMSLVVLSAR
jgi:hypothetical protein